MEAEVPPDQKVKAQKGPYSVPLEAGNTYYFCLCGRSKNQPFCDGSHSTTVFSPIQIQPEQSKTYHLCGCKHSNNLPYCDGTHNKLEW